MLTLPNDVPRGVSLMAVRNSLRISAHALQTELWHKGVSGIDSVGVVVDEEAGCMLVVYTNRRKVKAGDIPEEWDGNPVAIRFIGRVKPAMFE